MGYGPSTGIGTASKENILETGGSEPEITLPETCLVTHWVLTTKLIQQHQHHRVKALVGHQRRQRQVKQAPTPQQAPMTQMAQPTLNEHEALTKAQEQNANLMRTQPVAQITIPLGKVLTYTDQLQD